MEAIHCLHTDYGVMTETTIPVNEEWTNALS